MCIVQCASSHKFPLKQATEKFDMLIIMLVMPKIVYTLQIPFDRKVFAVWENTFWMHHFCFVNMQRKTQPWQHIYFRQCTFNQKTYSFSRNMKSIQLLYHVKYFNCVFNVSTHDDILKHLHSMKMRYSITKLSKIYIFIVHRLNKFLLSIVWMILWGFFCYNNNQNIGTTIFNDTVWTGSLVTEQLQHLSLVEAISFYSSSGTVFNS